MAEGVKSSPAAVAATVGKSEAPTAATPPRNTAPRTEPGAKGRPTGRVDTGPDTTGNKNGGKETREQTQDDDTEGAVGGEIAGPEEAAAAAQGIKGNSRDALRILAKGVRRTKEIKTPRPKQGETQKHITEQGLDLVDAQMFMDSKNEKLPPAKRALAFDYRIARLQMQTAPTQAEIAKVKAALAADDAAAADKKMTTDQRAAQEARLQQLNQSLGESPQQIQELTDQRAALEGSDQIVNQFQSLAERLCIPMNVPLDAIQNNPLGSIVNAVDTLRNIPPENSKVRANFFKEIQASFPDKKELNDLKRVAGMRIGIDHVIDIGKYGGVWGPIILLALALEAKKRKAKAQ